MPHHHAFRMVRVVCHTQANSARAMQLRSLLVLVPPMKGSRDVPSTAFKPPFVELVTDLRWFRAHLRAHGHYKLDIATAEQWSTWHTVEHAIYGEDHGWIVTQAREALAPCKACGGFGEHRDLDGQKCPYL